jgi:hypothetical protein
VARCYRKSQGSQLKVVVPLFFSSKNRCDAHCETISSRSPICTLKFKMREKTTLFRLQQFTHLQAHFADTAFRTLNVGGLSPLPHPFLFLFFPTTSLISLFTDQRSSDLAPPHLRPRAEAEQERRPFTRLAVLPRRPSPRPRRRQGSRWPSPYLATRGRGRGDRIRRRSVRL